MSGVRRWGMLVAAATGLLSVPPAPQPSLGSDASNLDAGDGNRAPMFIRDRRVGTATRISLSTTRIEATASSFGFHISSNGRYITFQSFASKLVSADANDRLDAFARGRKA
jgi:hypothetical protein